jgi:hypothetical protein
VAINLSSEWGNLLSTLQSKNKYVALDLSTSTMTGTEFDPGTATTGKDRIVSLTLPTAALSIKAGTSYSTRTFKNFTALDEIRGANVKIIGDLAFDYCKALSTVDLPAASSIGIYAFESCTALTSVSLPVVTSIGNYAFYSCSALSTVSLPAATSIGDGAFGNNRTQALTITLGATAPTLGVDMFSDITSKTVTVQAPSGATGYTSTWQDAFKGKGSAGTGTINNSITLTVQTY